MYCAHARAHFEGHAVDQLDRPMKVVEPTHYGKVAEHFERFIGVGRVHNNTE